MAGMLMLSAANLSRLTVSVFILAAVSDSMVIFSAPFSGSLTLASTRSFSLRTTSSRLGSVMAPVNKFFRRTDLGLVGLGSLPGLWWLGVLPLFLRQRPRTPMLEGGWRAGGGRGLVDDLAVFWELRLLGAGRKHVNSILSSGSSGGGTMGLSDIFDAYSQAVGVG